MLSWAPATRHSASEIRLSTRARPSSCSTASKANEPTFLAGDKTMALFVNPCHCPTYVDPSSPKRPSRKKRYFQTNLTLGGIGKMGNSVGRWMSPANGGCAHWSSWSARRLGGPPALEVGEVMIVADRITVSVRPAGRARRAAKLNVRRVTRVLWRSIVGGIVRPLSGSDEPLRFRSLWAASSRLVGTGTRCPRLFSLSTPG